MVTISKEDLHDLNRFANQRFSLKQWFAVGAHSCKLRKTGSGHCYLRIFYFKALNRDPSRATPESSSLFCAGKIIIYVSSNLKK